MNNLPAKDKMVQFREWLSGFTGHMDKFRDRYLDTDSLFKLTEMTIIRQPLILQCMQSPEGKMSVLNCIMSAKELQLRPGGARAQIHFVPFKKDLVWILTPIIDYRGHIAIIKRTNPGVNFSGEPVHEVDEFDFEDGSNPFIRHIRSRDPKRDESPLIAAYSVCHPADPKAFKPQKVMLAHEILKRMAVSRGASSDYSPWKRWPEMMWVKTAHKGLTNIIEGSEEISRALEIDDKGEIGETIYPELMIPETEPEKKTATKKLSEKIQRKTATDVVKGIEGIKKNPLDLSREPGDEPGIPSHVGPTQGDLE